MVNPPASSSVASRSLAAFVYLSVFAISLGLGGLLFLLGGIAVIMIPGKTPFWLEVGYVLAGIGGSVTIATLAAGGAMRRREGSTTPAQPQPASTRPSKVFQWLVRIAGTIVAAAGSAVVTAVVTRIINGEWHL